jgi:hypothetical protein
MLQGALLFYVALVDPLGQILDMLCSYHSYILSF